MTLNISKALKNYNKPATPHTTQKNQISRETRWCLGLVSIFFFRVFTMNCSEERDENKKSRFNVEKNI
jgi:hypothetical protein